MILIAISIFVGMIGYHSIGHLGWVDSLLNACMILAGMGPVDPLPNDAAKVFASFYSLYSGIAFLTIASLLFAPIFHRFLHRFHLDIYDVSENESNEEKV
ncbi:MAG: hypothetical protein NTX03_09565 [Bacteroidetes bacterium]|nr:hypothetical protein [Bacteroidota bacterium]